MIKKRTFFSFGKAHCMALLFMGITACGTGNLTPYSLPVEGLVLLEDGCDDLTEDAQTLTPLKATADMLALPFTMAMATLRLVTYLTVGVGLVLAGKDPQGTVDQINYVLPLPLSGPNPDRVKYHQGMVKEEGCLGF